MTSKPFLPALFALPFLAACSFNMATPPARSAFFGSPRVLPAREAAVTGEATGVDKLFGPSLAGGSLTYERGLGNQREIVVTPTAGVIQNESDYLGLSLDIKQGFPDTRNVAFTYGTGYLWNKNAQAVSGEAGVLLGYENRFFVPTLSLMLFLSEPFLAKRICSEPNEESETQCAKPTRTFGARVGITTEIKLPWRLSILPSAAFVPVQSQTHSFKMFQMSGALRWEY